MIVSGRCHDATSGTGGGRTSTVGVLDMLRYHTLQQAEAGRTTTAPPSSQKKCFNIYWAIRPCTTLEGTNYPATLVTTEIDDRVVPASLIQVCSTSAGEACGR